jgi:hypothetical protein
LHAALRAQGGEQPEENEAKKKSVEGHRAEEKAVAEERDPGSYERQERSGMVARRCRKLERKPESVRAVKASARRFVATA